MYFGAKNVTIGNTMKIILKIFSLFLIPCAFFLSCSASVQPRFEQVLGTVCLVNLYEKGTESVYDEIFARLEQIDDEFNLGKPDSDVSRINESAFAESVAVCDDVFRVIETAQKVSALTGGAFDISVGPLVSLWRVNTDSPHVATRRELDERLPLVDYRNIVLDAAEQSVRLKKAGMRLDLGGIAKGFAADEVVRICRKRRIRRAVIDLGGNVYVYGKKAKNQLWGVGVKNPEFPDSAPLLKLSVPQISVVTSGTYERFFEEGEKRYHHILSPETGFPIENELYSVTVLSESSMLADSLTTAFFVLGRERAELLLPRVREAFGEEISAIFIEKSHQISFSSGFAFEGELLADGWSVRSPD